MPTILIVEDEAKMRRLLELNLGEDGFSTLSAGDAEAELAHVAEICRAAGASEVRHARDEAERTRLWAGRKAAFPAVTAMAVTVVVVLQDIGSSPNDMP